jgi:hypothetical protein
MRHTSDISKNDAVAFANSILALQKRIEEVERCNASLEKMRSGIELAISKVKASVDELLKATFAPGQIVEKDHEVATK